MQRSITEDQIKHMVDRFLGWKLPESFNPDSGISFEKVAGADGPYPFTREPSGTNLFDASQATAMVRHMVEGLRLAQSTGRITEEMVENGCRGMYGKHWDGPKDKEPGPDMKEVWRKHARKCLEVALALGNSAVEAESETYLETVRRVAAAREKGYAAARANLQEAWAAMAMIRETVETLGPVGAMKASEHLDGPTFMHEAAAIIEGIRALLAAPPATQGDGE